MADAPVPQFGVPEPGVSYKDRPAAFGVLIREGRVAVVRVTKPGVAPWLDLPGGALDPGEDDAQAMIREFGEETGLVVAAGPLLIRADQVFRRDNGDPVNNRSAIFRAELKGEETALKCEDDHELLWVDWAEAAARLRHDSHAWAVLVSQRRRSA
jgi:8-oxo-dGTP diphosphatase